MRRDRRRVRMDSICQNTFSAVFAVSDLRLLVRLTVGVKNNYLLFYLLFFVLMYDRRQLQANKYIILLDKIIYYII